MPCRTVFDLDELKDSNGKIAFEMTQGDFWNDPAAAAVKSSQFEANKKMIDGAAEVADILAELGAVLNSDKSAEQEEELVQWLDQAEKTAAWLEGETLFSGPYDNASAVMMFHVGTGGVDAADFNQMLLAMYLQYAKNKGWKTEIVESSENEDGGLKSATIRVDGFRAYGYLKAESGVQRLIRISPFNAQGLRQTSFALVEVLPDMPDVAVEIKEDELRVETYRSSGKGGQSVNTTDSAVRITHIPSNISVAIQNERSQQQNKETAMRILKNKLNLLAQQERDAKERGLKAATSSGDFGQQVRTYTLHPYQQVKDHRSGYEVGQVDKVLKEGQLDEVVMSVLMWLKVNDQ